MKDFLPLNQLETRSAIGLTVARAWVEAHGGKIWAESDGLGTGSTFTFQIPT